MTLRPETIFNMVEAILLERFADRGCSEDEARVVTKAIVSVCGVGTADAVEGVAVVPVEPTADVVRDGGEQSIDGIWVTLTPVEAGMIEAARRQGNQMVVRRIWNEAYDRALARPSPSHDGGENGRD